MVSGLERLRCWRDVRKANQICAILTQSVSEWTSRKHVINVKEVISNVMKLTSSAIEPQRPNPEGHSRNAGVKIEKT
jgi:hypothetical protein